MHEPDTKNIDQGTVYLKFIELFRDNNANPSVVKNLVTWPAGARIGAPSDPLISDCSTNSSLPLTHKAFSGGGGHIKYYCFAHGYLKCIPTVCSSNF